MNPAQPIERDHLPAGLPDRPASAPYRHRRGPTTPGHPIATHNISGFKPYYAAVNVTRSEHLRLAALFSPKTVYSAMPAATRDHALDNQPGSARHPPGLPVLPYGADSFRELIVIGQ
ncbi:MAG: hypothetical protein RQ826_13005 [Xanthomonadales bacterium]|nr:hypothetical protein [Xanthomonadales bacterium]